MGGSWHPHLYGPPILVRAPLVSVSDVYCSLEGTGNRAESRAPLARTGTHGERSVVETLGHLVMAKVPGWGLLDPDAEDGRSLDASSASPGLMASTNGLFLRYDRSR